MGIMTEKLLAWYYQGHRQLPWRGTKDPYAIWLSEIMCQQTQVATVIAYYNRFLEKFPTIEALAKGTEEEVYKLWEGLGYYSRAKRLLLCSREVVNHYQGIFPNTYKEIIKLPGIGPYTAGAILSIAYNIKEPAIDGNVMRVYARLYEIEVDVGKGTSRKIFDPVVRKDLPEDVRHFNQAVMELGATICTPTKPKCAICPINTHCKGKEHHRQEDLPVKSAKPKKKRQEMTVLWLEHKGKVLLEKRPAEGLLANLWGLPIVEATCLVEVEDWLKEIYGIEGERLGVKRKKKHIFTHLIWDMTLVGYKVPVYKKIEDPEVIWVEEKALKTYSIPTAFRKLLE